MAIDAAPLRQVHPPSEPSETVRLLSRKVFRGCNRYHTAAVIRQRVDLGDLAQLSAAAAGPHFAQAFLARFGGLKSLVPDNGLNPHFIARLKAGAEVEFAEVLLQAILALENALAFARHELDVVAFAAIERHRRHHDLIWSCDVPALSRRAGELAVHGVVELLADGRVASPPADEPFAAAMPALIAQANRRRLSPTTAVLKLAAKKRGLPCEVVGRQHLRLGQGRWQQQIYSSMTGATSVAAQKVCADKYLTNRRLAELRLPVPQQIKVGSAAGARAAAARLGLPVVIKPLNGNKGGGVTAGLENLAGVEAAFGRAHRERADVVVERFIPGGDHRLLVVGGKFTAALTRRPPSVTGDGERSVDALIDELNADPRRDGFLRFAVAKDEELARLLRHAQLSLASVLDKGRTLFLRSAANVSTGGVAIDLTDRVHPDNRRMAERAAAGVGLDVAGIDFMTTDISRSYREVGGAIIEINARPGLCMHTWPEVGTGRNVAGAVLNLSYPDHNGRVPVVAVAGDRGTGVVARRLDAILRHAGRAVALALRQQAAINGVSEPLSEKLHNKAPLTLLRDPQIDTLVCTVSLRQAARGGLLLERCALTVFVERALGGAAALFQTGLGVMQRATSDCFVVSSADLAALNQLREVGARRLILVADRLDDPALQAHLAAGHTVLSPLWIAGEERIAVRSGADASAHFAAPVDAASGRRERDRKRWMFAIAAALGLGLSSAEIERALAAVAHAA